jgi:hypothetical protein
MRVRISTLSIGVAALCAPALLAAGAPVGQAAQQAKRPKHHHARARGHRKPEGHRPSSAFLRGVTIGDASEAQADQDIREARELHAQVVRMEASWAALEPNGPGQLDPGHLAAVDNVVRTAAANGMRVILLVESTPCWDSSAPPPVQKTCVPGRPSDANSWPPVNDAAFGAFVAYLAQRYGGALAALEIWNEPDFSGEQYLAGPNKAENYAAILKAAYPAIKSVDPSLPVLGGAIVGPNGGFLRALYADGIKGYYDGLAVHFYTLTLASLRAIHEVQLQNGDGAPLWLTEFGWTSCWPAQAVEQEQGCVTPAVQAANFVNITRTLARTPYVAGEVFYKFHDNPGEEFGVVTTNGSRKPSFAAVAGVFASPWGTPAPVTLTLRRAGRKVVARGSGPVGDFMELEVLKRGVPRYRTLFTLDRFNAYAITLPASLGTRNLVVRVWQYGKGASSATQRRL